MNGQRNFENRENSQHRPIKTPKQVLVEGRTPEIFFREWIESTALKDKMEARDFGSLQDLTGFLKSFSGLRDFREKVNAVGIIRDAEKDPPANAFNSVCSSLTAAGLTRPPAIGSSSDGTPRIGVFILPDCDHPGMLETLCWQALQYDTSLTNQLNCVTAYLDCLRATKTQIHNEPKAKVWTYLAGLGKFDPQLGRAAQAKIWNWSSPAFTRLSNFLNSL